MWCANLQKKKKRKKEKNNEIERKEMFVIRQASL